MNLQGKTALVTGASRGIGAAAAIQLARAGCANVIVQYNSYAEGAGAVMREIARAGAQGLAVQADFSTMEGVHRLLAAVRESGLDVDVLINNAGSLLKRAKLAELDEETYDAVMTLNAKSVWFMTRALAPAMIHKGEGIVVNVSSIAARNGGGPGATVYAASKAAVSAMTKGLAKELAPQGIRVNAISPGTVDNYFHEVFSTREVLEGVVKMTPAGRLGTNEEMADLILFLCSPQAAYIHGQTIEINGGMLAP
ncbi:MAG: glucose 1-dehydrogenase [Bryobacterales bacterium]|nr:glucose 1-dehydrogenase [Bryobacterales bacterium]